MMSVSYLAYLASVLQDRIAVFGLQLNQTHIIIGWILSIIFSDLQARRLRSIPSPLIVSLRVFFHADAAAYVHLLLV